MKNVAECWKCKVIRRVWNPLGKFSDVVASSPGWQGLEIWFVISTLNFTNDFFFATRNAYSTNSIQTIKSISTCSPSLLVCSPQWDFIGHLYSWINSSWTDTASESVRPISTLFIPGIYTRLSDHTPLHSAWYSPHSASVSFVMSICSC